MIQWRHGVNQLRKCAKYVRFTKKTILREPKAILNECVDLIKEYGLGPVNSFTKDEIQKIYFDLVSRLNWQYDIRLERKPEDYKK